MKNTNTDTVWIRMRITIKQIGICIRIIGIWIRNVQIRIWGIWILIQIRRNLNEPKFHYANFATKSGTSSRQSRGHKSWKSATQIMSPTFMICVVDFRDLCLWQSPWTLLPTLSPTFPVHCNGLNSIRATQTGLSRTCHGLCRKHLDMSRWFVSATFVICVGDFHQNFMVSWFVTVCVCNFHDLCPRLSPRRSFGESWRNGIWVIGMWVQ